MKSETRATGGPSPGGFSTRRTIFVCRRINALLIGLIGLWFFLVPSLTVVFDLKDPAVRGPGIPDSAWRLHRAISPEIARWAERRLASDWAAGFSTLDISGTEWPLFGSVFYLWGTEALQEAWERDHSLADVAPKIYAREAIEPTTSLVIDPKQAGWVR